MNGELSSELIVDPDKREGVVSDLRKEDSPVRLLDGYISEKTVRCAFCRQRQQHNRGYFVELASGQMALAGHCCALKIGGEASVRKIAKSVDKKRRNAELVSERNSFAKAIGSLAEFIETELLPCQQMVMEEVERLDDVAALKIEKTCGLGTLLKTLRENQHLCMNRYHSNKTYLLKKWPVWEAHAARVDSFLKTEIESLAIRDIFVKSPKEKPANFAIK